jgi:hypothetical protein
MSIEGYIDFDPWGVPSVGYSFRDQIAEKRFDKMNELVPHNHGNLWSDQDIRTLHAFVREGKPVHYIMRALGRTERSIKLKMEELGLYGADISVVEVTEPKYVVNKEKVTVNLHHLITLAQKGYTTIDVVFRGEGGGESRKYTYKVNEATAKTLLKDDLVVVEAAKHMKVAHVKEVHAEPQIDVKLPFALGWVVQKVDRAPYDQQMENEEKAVKMLEQGERKKAQKEALDTLLGSVDREEFMRLMNAV